MLGRLSWDGSRARIDYTHQNRERFGQDCFLPRFIEQRPCRGVPGMGKRRNPFPHDVTEAFALSALRFARGGATRGRNPGPTKTARAFLLSFLGSPQQTP